MKLKTEPCDKECEHLPYSKDAPHCEKYNVVLAVIDQAYQKCNDCVSAWIIAHRAKTN